MEISNFFLENIFDFFVVSKLSNSKNFLMFNKFIGSDSDFFRNIVETLPSPCLARFGSEKRNRCCFSSDILPFIDVFIEDFGLKYSSC